MQSCKPPPGPRAVDLDVYSPEFSKQIYFEAIGSLLFIVRGTRPDLSYIISKLSQYNQDPKDVYWKMVKES